ncbi:MAG: IS1595 family transposase [Stellaceae bacterium]
MSQHFLISPAARSLSIAQVLRLSDEEAYATFRRVRFAANGGEPFCPHCGAVKVYTLAETPIRWKCSGCRHKFSVTSGTLFHSRKLAIRDHLAVIALFCNGLKGVAALHMARDMNINPKSAFVLLHKLRQAMGATLGGEELAGEVEIDGAYFGRGPKQANRKADRPGRRTLDIERQVVVVARERHGDARTWVVGKEADAVPMIRANVASGAEVHADESGAWNILLASYPMKRVNHSVEYKGEDGACTNQAESYFSRLRRCEFGIHHRISGHRLQAYADEMAWRENHRRQPNGTHWNLITAAALAHPKSATWAGYWHREKAA